LPVYRVAVAFITLKSCGGAVATLHLAKEIIILGLFRFINSCAGSVGNFFDARRATLSGSSGAPACQESAGI
jgi:hypothetical protein